MDTTQALKNLKAALETASDLARDLGNELDRTQRYLAADGLATMTRALEQMADRTEVVEAEIEVEYVAAGEPYCPRMVSVEGCGR